jgi:hypothetical protein
MICMLFIEHSIERKNISLLSGQKLYCTERMRKEKGGGGCKFGKPIISSISLPFFFLVFSFVCILYFESIVLVK